MRGRAMPVVGASLVLGVSAALLVACGSAGGAAPPGGGGDGGSGAGAAGGGGAGGGGAGGGGSAPQPCDLVGEAAIETIGELSVGRYAPAAVLLSSGQVLIAGGYDFAGGIQPSATLFDPASEQLLATGSLATGSNFAAVASLGDEGVMVIGGFHPQKGSLKRVERYRPETGQFEALSPLVTGREAHTATRLPDGRVLVTGGLQAVGFVFHDSAEIYDPKVGAFAKSASPMTSKRAFHTATLLASGEEVLVVGGDSGAGHLASAERYVVATDTFVPTAGSRAHAGGAPAAALLDDGRVLVSGGANAADGTLADADCYEPQTDGFAAGPPMATRRMAHTLTRLDDGRVLAVGGWSDSSTPSASTGVLEVFDPATGAWTTLAVQLAAPRHDHVAVLLDDCRVLLAGGQQVVGNGAPQAPREVELITIPHVPSR